MHSGEVGVLGEDMLPVRLLMNLPVLLVTSCDRRTSVQVLV